MSKEVQVNVWAGRAFLIGEHMVRHRPYGRIFNGRQKAESPEFYQSGIERNDCLRPARNVFAVATDTGVGSSRRVRSTLSGAAAVRLTKACAMKIVVGRVFIVERRRSETEGSCRGKTGESLESEGEYRLGFIVGVR